MARTFKFVKVNNPNEAWRMLHEIADQANPELVRAFLQAILEVKAGISIPALEKNLRAYNVEGALDSLNWEEIANTELTPKVRSILRDVMETAGSATALPVSGTMDFDIVNPRAIDYIRNEVGNLITNVNAETVIAVRESIERGFQDGKGPRVIAEEIREYIGLNARQAGSFAKFKEALEAKGISGGRFSQLAGNQYKRLIKERALLIARTETINAAANGYREQLIQASEQGLLSSDKWEVAWLVTPDDRLCPLCRMMSGKRRPINGVYTEGPGAGKKCPTLHPRCRCAERTIRKASKVKVSSQGEMIPFPAKLKEVPPPVPASRKRNISFVPKGDVSPEHLNKLQSLIDSLPVEIAQKLEDYGVQFQTGSLNSSIRPSLKGVHPRGWPAGWTWDAAEGCYNHGTKTIHVTENVKRYGKISKNARVEGTFFHESGHAFDDAVGMISTSPEFHAAYRADRKLMKGNYPMLKRNAYFLQKGNVGPKEAFAEAFARILGVGSSGDAGMAFDWPKVFEFMRGYLKK